MSDARPDHLTEDIARRDEHTLRRGHLGAIAIAFFVISASAPLTGMGGGAPFAMLLGNGAGVPLAYALVTCLMIIFAVGYVAMARHHTSTGAFYSYLARGLGGYAGGAAALVALLGYNAMQIGLVALFGVLASAFMAAIHVTVSWWVMSLVGWALVAICGYRQIDLSLRVLALLVACEFIIVIIFDIMVLIKGGSLGGGGEASSLNFSSFTWDTFQNGGPSMAIAMLFAAASFVGFEATTIYSEEAHDPERTVPKATYIAVLTIGIFFVITSWLMVNAFGDNGGLVDFIGSKDLGDPTNFLFAMAGPYIGSFLTNYVMLFLFMSSLFAAILAFHNAVARYTYALGREGLVPERLGRTHKVFLSPHMGSLSQTVLSLVVLLLWVVLKGDPNNMFTWLSQTGTLAISFLMAFASLAVFAFFRRHPDVEPNIWKSTIAPLLAFLGLFGLSCFVVAQFGFLVGTDSFLLRWGLPLLIVLFAIGGAFSAHLLRGREPQAFATMGRHRPSEVGLDPIP